MALHRKLILNEADYAPFNLYGVGVCMAFSGNGIYRTKGACGTVKGDGSLPPGKYWIVERGSGGFFSRRQADQASLRISCRSSSGIAAMIGIAQSGLSSLYVIYYFAKLFSAYNIKYGFTKNIICVFPGHRSKKYQVGSLPVDSSLFPPVKSTR